MESQTNKKANSPVVSKQEIDEMIPEEINGGIITTTDIKIKKEPREEVTNTTELNPNQSTMDYENFIGNNDPINIKSEDVNTILDTGKEETYQHMMIGAGITLEDEVEKKPQLNLKGEIIDLEPGDMKNEPAEESSESSSEEEDSSEESANPHYSKTIYEQLGFRVNEKWRPPTSNRPPNNEKMYICSSCDFQHNQASRMRKHLIVHSEKFYQCDKCSLKTKHEKYLREHLKYVHRDPDTANIFVCDMCDFKTHRSNLLRKHKITHTIVGNQKKKVEMYKCEICNFKAKKKFVVQSHVNIHRPPSERVVYKCELCPYTSKFKGGVSNHMTMHKKPSEITMYECEVCPYKAKWSHCLRNHLKTHKKKEVPVHKCEHCNFKANNKYSVTTHQKSTHKELFEKPKKEYKCDLCEYTGKCTSDITRHKIVHKRTLKAEMFTCAICGMKTKRKETLKYHILTLHGFLERNLGSM